MQLLIQAGANVNAAKKDGGEPSLGGEDFGKRGEGFGKGFRREEEGVKRDFLEEVRIDSAIFAVY